MNVLKKFKEFFTPIDLTKGSILKGLVIFLIPILLSLVFQQIYTMTDAIIVGQNLGESEIAGINDVGPLSAFALQFAIGVTSGFSVVISHKMGIGNLRGARKSFLLQIWLSALLCVVLTVLFCFLVDPLLALMDITNSGGVEMQKVYQAAHDYLFVIYLGIVSQMGYNLIVSVLRALGDSFAPFLFLILGTLLNIVLDLLFIIPFNWGVVGAAWATNIAQLLATVACFIYAFKKFSFLRFQKEDFHTTKTFVLEHLKLGLPLGFQFSILEIGVILMQIIVIAFDKDANGLDMVSGKPAQLGYSVACKIHLIIMNVYMALGTAMLTFTGQNYGARKYDRIKKGFKISLLIGLICWVLLTAFGFLVSINGAYLYLFLKAENITSDVIKYGNYYLYVALPCDLILMVLFIARNSLQGLDKPLFPFLAGIGELIARCLVCLFLPVLVNGGPINANASLASYIAVSFADPLAWLAATIIMIIPLIKFIYRNKEDPDYLASLKSKKSDQ